MTETLKKSARYVQVRDLLEQAARNGSLVVNDPRSLRDANEKIFTIYFPQCCPPLVVSRQSSSGCSER